MMFALCVAGSYALLWFVSPDDVQLVLANIYAAAALIMAEKRP